MRSWIALRPAHLLRFVILIIATGLLLRAQPAAASAPVRQAQQPTAPTAPAAVEHWEGVGYAEGHLDVGFHPDVSIHPEVAHGGASFRYSLDVDSGGNLTGNVRVQWNGSSHIQPGAVGNCISISFAKAGYNCSVTMTPTSGTFTVAVTGSRIRNSDGTVEFVLNIDPNLGFHVFRTTTGTHRQPRYSWAYTYISEFEQVLRFGAHTRFSGPPQTAYGRVLVEADVPYRLDQGYTHKRIDLHIALVETGGAPTLRLDKELLERSVFMDRVSVLDALTANLTWHAAGGGSTTWRLPTGSEQTPFSPNTVIPRSVDVGALGLSAGAVSLDAASGQPVVDGTMSVGVHDVTVQGKDTLDRKSLEEMLKLVVAEYFDRCPRFTVTKTGAVVTYKCEVKEPDPALEAQIKNVPAIIPYFGGKPLGMGKAQISAVLKLQSTGGGSLSGGVGTTFAAMGGEVGGKLTLKGDLKLEPSGVRFVGGAVELELKGKFKKTEPLLVAIPALAAVFNAARAVAPSAVAVLAKLAEATVEVSPKIGVALNLVGDPDPAIGWKFAPTTIPVGADFKSYVKIAPIKDELELSAGIGGGLNFIFQVPADPDYLKSATLNFLGFAELKFWKFTRTAEYTCTLVYPGLAVTCGDGVQAANAAQADAFGLMDRAYLTSPGYSAWVAQGTPARGKLVQNVGPLARPASQFYSLSDHYVVWSYDKPGSNALNGDELAWADISPNGPSSGYSLLTNDDRADWNPQLGTDFNTPLVIWQRMDTAAPGDFNANPTVFLSHMQIAAGTLARGGNPPTLTPVQISTSGSINHRPLLAVRGNSNPYFAVWINNPANLLAGDAAHPDRFMYAIYNRSSNAWSAPQAITGTVPGVLSAALANGYDQALSGAHNTALIFTADADGNPDTANDVEVYYALYTQPDGFTPPVWTPIRRLTNNAINETDVQIAWLARDLALPPVAHIIWRVGNQVVYLPATVQGSGVNATLAGAPQTLPFTLADGAGALAMALEPDYGALAVAWPQPGGIASIRLWPDWDTWSQPRVETVGTGYTTPVSVQPEIIVASDGMPSLSNLALLLTTQVENNALITRTVGGVSYPNVTTATSRDLYAIESATRAMSPTIATDDIQILTAADAAAADADAAAADVSAGDVSAGDAAAGVAPTAPASPDALVVRATVRNQGDEAADRVRVALVRPDDSADAGVTVLAAVTVTVPGSGAVLATLPVPAGAASNGVILSLRLTRAPQGCTDDFCNRELDAAPLPVDAVGVEGAASDATPHAAIAHALFAQASLLRYSAPLTATVRNEHNGPVIAIVGVNLPFTANATVDVSSAISPALLGPGDHFLYWRIDNAGDPNPLNNETTSLVTVAPDLFINPYLTRVDGSRVLARVENRGNWPSVATTLEAWSGPPGTSGAVKVGIIAVPPLAPGAFADLSGSATVDAAQADAQSRARYMLLDPANTVAEIDENSNTVAIGYGVDAPATGAALHFLPIVKK